MHSDNVLNGKSNALKLGTNNVTLKNTLECWNFHVIKIGDSIILFAS